MKQPENSSAANLGNIAAANNAVSGRQLLLAKTRPSCAFREQALPRRRARGKSFLLGDMHMLLS
jgi:hypothetical protein